MRVKDCQRLLASIGAYKGGVDGDYGPKTEWAATQYASINNVDIRRLSKKRRLIAVCQHILNSKGFEAGSVDGYAGHNTNNAYEAWEYKKIHGKKESVKRKPAPYKPSKPSGGYIPTQAECPSYYGKTRKQVESQLVTITVPFYFVIAWNKRQKTNKLRLHKKCAQRFKDAWTEVYKHYGDAGMKKLGLNVQGGTFIWRKMRGGSRLSMHSYGCAQDVHPKGNGLRVGCPQAKFCKPEYKAFLDIMEKHGCLPAIRLWGKDAMHFQVARLR